MLFKTWQAGADLYYQSAGNGEMMYGHEKYYMNVSLSKSFLNGKLRVNLRGTDLFNTRQTNMKFDMNGILNNIRKDENTRGVQLSVTYRFNATPSKYKGAAASDELNRL
jgi:hypothetical protein